METKVKKYLLAYTSIVLYIIMAFNLRVDIDKPKIVEAKQTQIIESFKPITNTLNYKTQHIEEPTVTVHEEYEIKKEVVKPKESQIESLLIDTPKYNISKQEEKLLLDLVFCEANTESIECQMAVIQVVLNRVEDENFPDTIYEVIYQHKGDSYQFTPAGSGALKKATPTKTNCDVLEMVLNGECTIPSNILFFWTTDVEVDKVGTWYYKMHHNNFFKQIDNTYFYDG